MLSFLNQIDYSLFQSINQHAGSFEWLDTIMKTISHYAPIFFILLLISFWLISPKNRIMVIQSFIAAGVAVTISKGIQLFMYRDRPFVTYDVNQLMDYTANSSFPSDHTVGAFVIACTIFFFMKRTGLSLLVLATFVAISRIWIGVHFPVDVIVGVALGITTAIITKRYIMKLSFIKKYSKKLATFRLISL